MLDSTQIKQIKLLCKKYSVKNLYVFGSVLSDTFNKESDIDFLINFSDELSHETYTENYFNLHVELEQIFNRKIDLIAENTLKNPYLIQSINENKELIYNAA